MDGYRRGGHTKYSLKMHVILVTKYRKPLFKSKEFSEDVKQYIYDIAVKHRYTIIQMEVDTDHIHILIEYPPGGAASTVVSQLKQYSTYNAWKHHCKYLLKSYWKKRNLWSDGYFCCGIGQVSQAVIERYIAQQG